MMHLTIFTNLNVFDYLYGWILKNLDNILDNLPVRLYMFQF